MVKTKAEDWLANQAKLTAGCADRQSIAFAPDTWRAWLTESKWEPQTIERLLSRFPSNTISRPELRAMSKSSSDDDARRDLLVAALMWGRGKKNGRMKPHILKLLQSSDLDRVLALTATSAASGNPTEAYRSWTLPGLQEPFFTKWLWAASCATENRHCLVLDSRVWRTLGELGWSSIESAGTRDRAARYGAYVDACHQWAVGLGNDVSAEDVEWALFSARGDLTWTAQLLTSR